MRVLLVDAFHTGSHARWSRGWQRHSHHAIELLTLPGRHWKWRMFGAAPELARRAKQLDGPFDALVVTDMLDLPTFLALSGLRLPTILYFHENQLTYPWSASDGADARRERNRQYGFLNFTSCLAADRVWFNSAYHRTAFLEELPAFLRAFPDHRMLDTVADIDAKSSVQPLGLDLAPFLKERPTRPDGPPVLLWNHRHEYDKNPEQFFTDLRWLRDTAALDFRLVVLGESYTRSPEVFRRARTEFAPQTLHWGYTTDRSEYVRWVRCSDLLYVTSHQDFFGGSVVEAIAAGAVPVLPRRLAYPEHLPPEERDPYLYASPAAGRELLAYWLRNIGSRNIEPLRSAVRRYDWTRRAPKYDRALQS